MQRSRWCARALAAACGVTVTAISLGGCSVEATPTYRIREPAAPAVIQVPEGDTEALVLGEVYRLGLKRASIASRVEEVSDPRRLEAGRLAWLAEGEADLVIGCTGEFLTEQDPQRARDLLAELRGGFDDAAAGAASDASQETYDAFMGVLGGEYDVPDPSPAQWCSPHDEAGAEGLQELPNNVVPVYRKSAINRWGKRDLNAVTRLLTARDIEEMAEDVDAGGRAEDVVLDWIKETNPGLLHAA